MTRLPVVPDLGAYLREQRMTAQLSLRQLAARAGVSNPYLSQIERGLRKPSAEILGALADALDLSAEALYVRAGILPGAACASAVPAAVAADPALSEPQRKALLDLYALFVGGAPEQRRSHQPPEAHRPPEPPPTVVDPDPDPVPVPSSTSSGTDNVRVIHHATHPEESS